MKNGKPFSNKEFISILHALHPDSTSKEYRDAAFALMKEKEVLLRPEEKDRPLSGGLPKTLAELVAMQRPRRRLSPGGVREEKPSASRGTSQRANVRFQYHAAEDRGTGRSRRPAPENGC